MIAFDLSRSPLLIAVVIGAADAPSTQAAQAAWQALVTTDGGFAALQVFVDHEAAAQIGSDTDLEAWLASQPASAQARLWRLARVVLEPDSAARPLQAGLDEGRVRDFADILSALRWLEQTALAPRHHTLSLEGAASTVAGLCWEADV